MAKLRPRPWEALAELARTHGDFYVVRITYARNEEWSSAALRARDPETGRRVVALWRGRDLNSTRFTSAMTWGPGVYFTPLTSAQLKALLRGE